MEYRKYVLENRRARWHETAIYLQGHGKTTKELSTAELQDEIRIQGSINMKVR
jgi:NAD(P)H-flavin reductase